MRFLERIPQLLRRKKREKIVEEKSEVKEKVKKGVFPGISTAEQKKYIGKHVLIVGGRIVVSAGTAKRAFAIAKRKYYSNETELWCVGSEKLLIKCKCIKINEG